MADVMEDVETGQEELELSGPKPFSPEGLGLYAPFEISPEDMYVPQCADSPDGLSVDAVSAIKKMVDDSCLYENAAWFWEKIQAAEARLFDRGYQWLTNDKTGCWQIAGTAGTGGVGAGAVTQQDRGRMWSINIYGARKDKIVAAVTVKDPVPEFFPTLPESALDQQFADEADKYKHLWKMATNVRNLCVKIGGLFYTDDRVALITESLADAQKFGKDKDKACIREVTRAYGKLEFSVPMSIDEDDSLPWCRRAKEIDVAVAKEKYSWISNISAGGGGDGKTDRTCRLTVRNAVNNVTGFTSNATDRAVTETTWWVRPSQYRDIVDPDTRKWMRETFEDGARVVFIGGEFAYIRNEKMDDCVVILYSREGTGQNRRAIGSNNLITQKVLNYDFNLFNRYMTSCVPRKMHIVDAINSEAINQQRADPAFSMPVSQSAASDAGGLSGVTGTENVPTPPAQLLDFITEMTNELPEILDGAGDAMWGGQDVTDTAKGITIQRDQALQVFGTPFNAMNWGVAISCGNAARWAGRNRSGTESGMVPGVGRISVNMAALAGGTAYCFPEADSGFPESEAEKEQRLMDWVENSANVPIVASSLADPMNFEALNRVSKRCGLKIVGADSVRKQQEEFEDILKSVPRPNPAFLKAQMQVQKATEQAQTEPDAQTPEGQQGLQQVQQAAAAIPPEVCSVPVEQDASVNHNIEATVCFNKINSPEGQKLKREQPKIFQNLMLHWQGHTDMAAKLAPKSPPQGKASANVAIDKLGPAAQVAMLEAEFGVSVAPEEVQPSPDLHEISQEKNGIDAQGVPVKQKISYSGAALQ